MEKNSLYVLGNLLLIFAMISSILVLALFSEEIVTFVNIYFTREFVVLVIKWGFLTLWLTAFVLGSAILLYLRYKRE